MSNLNPTAKQLLDKGFQTDCSTPLRYFPTLTTSLNKVTPKHIREWLMSLPQVSPVNRSALQVKDKSMTNGICGPKQPKSSGSFNPDTLFLRTSPACYLQNRMWMESQGDLFHTALPFSGTWLKQGIMQDGRCWAQTIAGPDIEEKDFGYWRTLDTCAGGAMNKGHIEKVVRDLDKGISPHTLRLQDQVKDKRLWKKN